MKGDVASNIPDVSQDRECAIELRESSFEGQHLRLSASELNSSRSRYCYMDQNGPSPPPNDTLESNVYEIRRDMRLMLNLVQQKEFTDAIAKEWQSVALVLDRIFFLCYLVAIVISLATIFPLITDSA